LLQTEPVTTSVVLLSVPMKSPTPAANEVEEGEAGAGQAIEKDPRVAEPAPEIPTGKLIEPPPPAGTFLPKAHLIVAGKAADTLQWQQSPGVQSLWVLRARQNW
jgi:hypothetical protein